MACYAERYGVDRYTAYAELATLDAALPASAGQWAQRPPATPRRAVNRDHGQPDDDWWIMVDGRPFFVAGYTAGGVPYGCFIDETADGDL